MSRSKDPNAGQRIAGGHQQGNRSMKETYPELYRLTKERIAITSPAMVDRLVEIASTSENHLAAVAAARVLLKWVEEPKQLEVKSHQLRQVQVVLTSATPPRAASLLLHEPPAAPLLLQQQQQQEQQQQED